MDNIHDYVEKFLKSLKEGKKPKISFTKQSDLMVFLKLLSDFGARFGKILLDEISDETLRNTILTILGSTVVGASVGAGIGAFAGGPPGAAVGAGVGAAVGLVVGLTAVTIKFSQTPGHFHVVTE